MAERPKAADSRSALAGVPRFESWPRHQNLSLPRELRVRTRGDPFATRKGWLFPTHSSVRPEWERRLGQGTVQEHRERRFIWLEMDEDRSRSPFSPRKGEIVDSWEEPPDQGWALVRRDRTVLSFLPVPRSLKYLYLRGFSGDPPISRVFRTGIAVMEVLRPRGLGNARRRPLQQQRLWRLGWVDIYPWPKPSPSEFSAMLRRARAEDHQTAPIAGRRS